MNELEILSAVYKYVYTVYGQCDALDVIVDAYIYCKGSTEMDSEYPIGILGVSSLYEEEGNNV